MPFTVFNCGTGANRETSGELVSDLAKIINGQEGDDWIINAGPGSKRTNAGDRDATPGIRDGITGERKTLAKIPLVGTIMRVSGLMTGFGWEDNVAKSLYYIRRYVRQNPGDDIVNMAGWSRGGITCVMLAHALANDADLSTLRCNLFLADPVPGPGNFDPDKITMPTNVSSFIAVYQQQEARSIMRPAPYFGTIGREIIFMPGKHATGVKFEKTAVGVIVYSLAQEFLSTHGSVFNNHSGILNDWMLIEAYTEVSKLNQPVIPKPKSRVKKLFSLPNMTGRTFTRTGNRTAFGNDKWTERVDFDTHRFFVNGHHFALMRRRFPKLTRALMGDTLTSSDIIGELGGMEIHTPITYNFFQKVAPGAYYRF